MSANSRRKKRKKAGNAPRPAACWEPVPGNPNLCACSACGFRIEMSRAVETGWSVSEQTALRYKFCPECGTPMALMPEPPAD